MGRLLRNAFVWVPVVLGLGALAAVILYVNRESYDLQAAVFWTRYGKYDELIAAAARRHGVSPSLVKAVIWRESKFDPSMVGQAGERGLMHK